MTDITSSFLQQVSACKKYDSGGSTSWNDKHKSRIIKSPQKKLPFVTTATEISKNIIGLQNFLKEHKKAYLDTSAKYRSTSNFMTEDQKDDIDREAVSTIDKCKSGISSLQHSLMEYKKRRTVEGDVMSHLIGIVDILHQNLMGTAGTFKKYKKERIKKKMQEAEGYFKLDAIKRNTLSPMRRGNSLVHASPDPLKLRANLNENTKEGGGSGNGMRNRSNSISNKEKDNNNNNTTTISPNTSPVTGRRSRSNSTNNSTSNRGNISPNLTVDMEVAKNSATPIFGLLSPTPKNPLPSSSLSLLPAAPLSPLPLATINNLPLNKNNSWLASGNNRKNRSDFNSSAELLASEESKRGDEDEDEDVLLDSERDLLEAENASLQREFDTMVDQVRVIDQQLVAVSGLFDELTEHAVLQKETMDTISDLTENAIGHVKQGVGQLQVATKRTVDFRLMVLLFLITCSVSLLFLHWYEQ